MWRTEKKESEFQLQERNALQNVHSSSSIFDKSEAWSGRIGPNMDAWMCWFIKRCTNVYTCMCECVHAVCLHSEVKTAHVSCSTCTSNLLSLLSAAEPHNTPLQKSGPQSHDWSAWSSPWQPGGRYIQDFCAWFPSCYSMLPAGNKDTITCTHTRWKSKRRWLGLHTTLPSLCGHASHTATQKPRSTTAWSSTTIPWSIAVCTTGLQT